MEDRFVSLLRGTGLPAPYLNASLEVAGRRIEADCLWRRQRVIVELDSHGVHGTRAAFESDRERDRRLQAEGWTVVRVTWRQLDDWAAVHADLCRLLGAGRPS
jgi:very-short-patch-repair endonuclease